jgi:N-acetylglucosamine-6-phosphate deacetylase
LRLGVRAALVDGELVDGDATIEDGAVTAVGVSPAGGAGIAVPGYVDVHTNGYRGVDFWFADEDGWRSAAVDLAATGVVAFQPTFVSSPASEYADHLAVASAAVRWTGALPRVVGVHIEGPFLSPSWPGAHDPANLIAPDVGLAASFCDAGPVTTMTIAPELEGADALIAAMLERGVIVSIGHSDAEARVAHRAFDAGAAAITHIHNAHRRWKPRDPGLGGVALARPDVHVQAIVDGVHMAPESAWGVALAAGRRLVAVTDGVEATGMPDGDYTLAGIEVTLRDGAVRRADGTLAGSALTMDAAVRNLVSWGASLADAVHAASSAPAALLGRDDLGRLGVGAPAHITVVDDDLRVIRTLVGGEEAFAA